MKYIVTWDDLDDSLKKAARKKAISTYDENDAWDRSTDQTPENFKIYEKQCRTVSTSVLFSKRRISVN